MIWGLTVPLLYQEVANFSNLAPGLSKKLAFSLTFEPILRDRFFDTMLALSNKQSTFVLLAFLAVVFHNLFKCYLKGHFLTKNAPQTTIITILKAESR